MELKLPIYEGRNVAKTYTADTVCISFGTVEDIIDALHLDGIQTEKEIGIAVLRAIKQLRPLLKDIFDGVTDDEIRRTHVNDLITLFSALFRYAVDTLNGVTGTVKNLTPGA